MTNGHSSGPILLNKQILSFRNSEKELWHVELGLLKRHVYPELQNVNLFGIRFAAAGVKVRISR